MNQLPDASTFMREYAGRPACLIELPGVPKGKGRPRFTRKGIAFTPADTRSYESALAWAGKEAMQGAKPFECSLVVVVVAHMPIPRSWSKKQQQRALANEVRPNGKPDADNLIKSLDAFNGIVWRDDAQIVDVRCVKIYSERPRLVVTVEALS